MNIKIYLASPFFNEEEVTKVKELKNWLITKGAKASNIYVPMEHEPRHKNPDWEKEAYDQDIKAIEECDMLLAIYNGNVSDSGTAFEIGYAKALRKVIIVVNMNNLVNLMITQSATLNLNESFELIDYKLLNQT